MVRKKEKFSRCDVVDYLKSEGDVAAYPDAFMEEAGDEAAYIAAALADFRRCPRIVRWCPGPESNRYGVAPEGFSYPLQLSLPSDGL